MSPIAENAKIFWSYVENFEFSHVKQMLESWLVYANKLSWIIQSYFLTDNIKLS